MLKEASRLTGLELLDDSFTTAMFEKNGFKAMEFFPKSFLS
jgi:hypothetical protein